MCAPPMEGCLARPLPLMDDNKIESIDSSPDVASTGYTGTGFILGVRAAGNWTKALNSFAYSQGQHIRQSSNARCKCLPLRSEGMAKICAAVADDTVIEDSPVPVPAYVMVDGPYGGCSIDPSAFETAVFVSGGSGATFTIGLLDELVGKCLRRTRQVVTRKIEFAWFIRSFGENTHVIGVRNVVINTQKGAIRWFGSLLNTIARQAAACPDLDLHITIYVTCLCDPDAVPQTPNCDVLLARPKIGEVIKRVVYGTPDPAKQVEEGDLTMQSDCCEKMTEESESCGTHTLGPAAAGSGLAVCASGSQELTREAANVMAALSASKKGRELRSIAFHTEVYAI